MSTETPSRLQSALTWAVVALAVVMVLLGLALHGFSVDVVDMQNLAGPHHTHPNGEIDLVMPIEGDALFDGRPAGWVVMPPGSAHRPTVSAGRALVLYLLPQGAIEFTK